MKRSELSEIVSAVRREELDRIRTELHEHAGEKENIDLFSLLVTLAEEITTTAARTTAEILKRSGAISLEDDPIPPKDG